MGEYGTSNPILWFMAANRFSDMQAAPPTGLLTLGGNAAGDLANFRWLAFQPCFVYAIGYIVTTLVNYDTQTAQEVIAFDRRTTFGSGVAADRTEIGRIGIDNAASLTVGSMRMLRVNRTNAQLFSANEIIAEVITQGTGGGALAGVYTPFIIATYEAEQEVLMARVAISATAQVV
mgnify:CR=1 FL=1